MNTPQPNEAPVEVCQEIKHVLQEDPMGCLGATLAMVLGITYEQACAKLGGRPLGHCYYCDTWDQTMIEEGWAVCRKWKWTQPGNKERNPWPLEPWADLHEVEVKTSMVHSVIMLRDGTVLDPLTTERKRLSDYSEVLSIAALYNVRACLAYAHRKAEGATATLRDQNAQLKELVVNPGQQYDETLSALRFMFGWLADLCLTIETTYEYQIFPDLVDRAIIAHRQSLAYRQRFALKTRGEVEKGFPDLAYENAPAVPCRYGERSEDSQLLRQLEETVTQLAAAQAEIARLKGAIQGVVDSCAHPDQAIRAVMVPLKPLREVLAQTAANHERKP